jgi:predicted RNase H-like HicB family nuclease
MAKLFYPAVIEKGAKGLYGAWFPDFPDCVVGGRSQEEAIEKAEFELSVTVHAYAERETPLPKATPIESIQLPKGCRLIAYFVVGVEPPNPSERVNIYLPKNLLARADAAAAQLGVSRSSFFGLAISSIIGMSQGIPGLLLQRPTGLKVVASEKKKPAAKRTAR